MSVVWASRTGAVSPAGPSKGLFSGVRLSPDGHRAAVSGVQMFWKRWDDPDGAPGALAPPKGQDEPLAPGIYARIPRSWTADGKYLAFTENHPDTRRDIWILPVAPAAKPLFELEHGATYDVTPDGQRFLMLRPDYSQYPKNLVLVHQWPAEIRR